MACFEYNNGKMIEEKSWNLDEKLVLRGKFSLAACIRVRGKIFLKWQTFPSMNFIKTWSKSTVRGCVKRQSVVGEIAVVLLHRVEQFRVLLLLPEMWRTKKVCLIPTKMVKKGCIPKMTVSVEYWFVVQFSLLSWLCSLTDSNLDILLGCWVEHQSLCSIWDL